MACFVVNHMNQNTARITRGGRKKEREREREREKSERKRE